MKNRSKFMLLISLAAVLILSVAALPGAATAAPLPNRICEFYYGGMGSTSIQRIVDAKPNFLVTNTPAGTYNLYAPVATFQNAGIKVFSYISTGYLKEYEYSPTDAPPNDYTTVMNHIRGVAAEGSYGVFFDESVYDANTPGQKSWTGHKLQDITDYAHSLGLKVMLGIGSLGFNANLWTLADYILTDEWYTNRGPGAEEAGHLDQCIVIGHNANSATTAANYTTTAFSKGFGMAYHTSSYGTMASWFEDYMARVGQIAPSSSTSNPSTYSLTISVSGQGTTNPAPGTRTVNSGSSISITATPATGYVFDHWAGDVSGTANPVSFRVNSNTSVQAIFTPIAPVSSGTESYYERNTSSNDQDNLAGSGWKGQTFTPATTHTVTKIRLPLIRVSNSSGEVVVSIRRTDANGLPTGPDLASGSIPVSSLGTSWARQVWYDISLGNGYQLSANTKYALIVRAPSSSSNIYYWVSTSGTYGKGEMVYSYNSGSAWYKGGNYSGWDMAFEEWGN